MTHAQAVMDFFGRTPLLLRSLFAYALIAGAWFGIQLLIVATSPAPLSPPHVAAYTPPVKVGTAQRAVQGTPARIQVERFGIDLPINPGTYDAKTGEWTLSDAAAYFATITDKPNDTKGSTFIYGHNRQSVFAKLAGVKAGDTVKIFTTEGPVFTYTYARDASVSPNMTDILYEHPVPPQLVLMTCEGLTSATRRIMYFTLTDVTPGAAS